MNHIKYLLVWKTKIQLLLLQVKHCRTSSPSSYGKNLSHLIGIYAGKKKSNEKKWSSIAEELDDCSDSSADNSISDGDVSSPNDMNRIEDDCCDVDGDELNLTKENGSTASREKEMSIEYLENDVDVFHIVDDWDGIHLSINLDHVRCCIILAGCKNMP